MHRAYKIALGSLVLNVVFSDYHLVIGVVTESWWMITLGVYYFILSSVRFVVLRVKKMNLTVMKITGGMLMALSFPLAATVILSVISDRGNRYHEIIMIAIATCSFLKITLATVNFIRSRHSKSKKLITLRNVSFADGFVSIFALQRSMLVSFEGMSDIEILIMNAATGSVVCVIAFMLGLNLVICDKKFNVLHN